MQIQFHRNPKFENNVKPPKINSIFTAEKTASESQAQARDMRMIGSLNPLFTPTRLNGERISSVVHLSHEEWVESLSPKARQHYDALLDTLERFFPDEMDSLRIPPEERVRWAREAEETVYDIERLERIRQSFGEDLVDVHVTFYPNELVIAFFPETGDIRIRFSDGSELFFEGAFFDSLENPYNRFLADALVILNDRYNINSGRIPLDRLKEILEGFFSEIFDNV
ncbi:MAG: hypothetical protein FWG65_08420 [Turicibacter sp.]|nr:hypothetical protein [Turicibacter sp.]